MLNGSAWRWRQHDERHTMSETIPNAASKGGKRYLVLILAVLAVVLAATGAFWYMRRSAPAPESEHTRARDRGIVVFDPFVVNLADAHASRFLRATVHLIVGSAEEAERLQKTPVALMQARSAILDLLTVQTADRLVTPDGKTALRKAIAERVGGASDEVKVLDVLFSDFVVQF